MTHQLSSFCVNKSADRAFYDSLEAEVMLNAELSWDSFVEWVGEHASHDRAPCTLPQCATERKPCTISSSWFGCQECLQSELRCSHQDEFILWRLAEAFPRYSAHRLHTVHGQYHGYHAHARAMATLPGQSIKGLQEVARRLKEARCTTRRDESRVNEAIGDLQRLTFQLGIGESVMLARLNALEALARDIGAIVHNSAVMKLESAEDGMGRLAALFEDRRYDIWDDLVEGTAKST